jgi:excisionase family DNA binding protein
MSIPYPKIATEDRLAIRILDACAMIGISRSHFYDLMADGQIATFKIGGRRLVSRNNLEDFLRRMSDAHASKVEAA